MNKQLDNPIFKYSTLAAILLGVNKVNGQVVYMDINPDDTLSSSSNNFNFPLDIDQDGMVDFNFHQVSNFNSINSMTFSVAYAIKMEANSFNGVFSIPLNSGFLNCTPYLLQPQFRGAFPFNINDTIPNQGVTANPTQVAVIENWADLFATTYTLHCFNAIDSVNQDVCIGFILSGGSVNKYGWMRLGLLNKMVILKDYVYQFQPNTPVLSCSTFNLTTGIVEGGLQLNFSQQNNSIHISTFQNLNHANILVYDLLGKEILQQSFSGKETTVTIDKKGIYFVEVNSDKGILRKKVFIY